MKSFDTQVSRMELNMYATTLDGNQSRSIMIHACPKFSIYSVALVRYSM